TARRKPGRCVNQQSLFEELEERQSFERRELTRRLADLTARNIFIGGSSWKYEGWIDRIYTRSRYFSKGKFSRKLFNETCMSEYATVFPTVCGDFAFYQFPTEDFWRRLFDRTPEGFQFAFKVPEQITCPIFSSHARYGPQSGSENPAFLDPVLLHEGFLRPLRRHLKKTALLIFEFGTFSRKSFAELAEFLERLDIFLGALPRDFRYAVEIRNWDFLIPDYFSCLRGHGIAHVYNAWTRMPELPEQISIPESKTADFLVCRALLKQGRPYENAVRMFSPYAEVQEVNDRAREGMRDLIQIARDERRTMFLFVNNRLEGNAPGTILSITD
ncbi:MAG: DUF72 domain-containing protein, partial [Acidobacteriota bacterium]|nr:DUF72 domain-containing protein [Acidobacteriota bacterium]